MWIQKDAGPVTLTVLVSEASAPNSAGVLVFSPPATYLTGLRSTHDCGRTGIAATVRAADAPRVDHISEDCGDDTIPQELTIELDTPPGRYGILAWSFGDARAWRLDATPRDAIAVASRESGSNGYFVRGDELDSHFTVVAQVDGAGVRLNDRARAALNAELGFFGFWSYGVDVLGYSPGVERLSMSGPGGKFRCPCSVLETPNTTAFGPGLYEFEITGGSGNLHGIGMPYLLAMDARLPVT